MQDRIITTGLRDEDFELEPKLRPQSLESYVGQEKVKENLRVFIEAAKQRKESLDHVLLYGPPGLGKTTLSNIIASEMGVNIKVTSGPAIERPGDMAAILNSLNEITPVETVAEEYKQTAIEQNISEDMALNKCVLNTPEFKRMIDYYSSSDFQKILKTVNEFYNKKPENRVV